MDILNRDDYSITVNGSDKIFYGSYPYKVKLKDNNIRYDWRQQNTLTEWARPITGDPDSYKRRMNMKVVNNWSRNYYFLDKGTMTDFVEQFEDRIDHISGPISEFHVEQLEMLNTQRRDADTYYVLKGNYYYDEYDIRLIWRFPYDRLTNNYDDVIAHYDTLGQAVVDSASSARWYQRNAYCKESDLQDIEFFCKLKFGDVIQQKVKVIFVDNL